MPAGNDAGVERFKVLKHVGAGAQLPCESPAMIPLVLTGTDSATDCVGPPFDVAVIRRPATPPCVRVTGPPFVKEKSKTGTTVVIVVCWFVDTGDCGCGWVCGWTAPGDKTPLRDGAFSCHNLRKATPSAMGTISAPGMGLDAMASPIHTPAKT